MEHSRRLLITSFLMALLSALPLFGASRALLIGVSYQGAPHLGKNAVLPGIDLDVAVMKQVATELGISDIRVLWDSQATLAGIRNAIQGLGAGLTKDDVVLIYYSGHGAQTPDESGDESDGKDEVLVPFDAMPGNGRLGNVLLDEELGSLLRGIPSERVVLIIDACNSGTAAKSYGPQPKAYLYQMAEAAPKSSGDSRGMLTSSQGGKDNFVGIMAAQDHEFAIATAEGSVLTNAVLQTVAEAKKRGGKIIRIRDLFDGVSKRVDAVTGEMKARNPGVSQHPNLFLENAALQNLELTLGRGIGVVTAPPPNEDPLIRYWGEFAKRASEEVPLYAQRNVFQVHPAPGDPATVCKANMQPHLLAIEVVAPRDGYMTLINAGEGEGKATVLFPNQYQPDNSVKKGQRVVVPAAGQERWCLPAMLPAGRTSQAVLVVAVFGEKDINLYRNGEGPGPFKSVADARSFGVMPGAGAHAGQDRTYAAASALFRVQK